MTSGTMDFIEPHNDKQIRKSIIVEDSDVLIVERQLEDSYQKIQDHKFDEFCEDEDCQWCNFVRNNYEFKTSGEVYLDDTDQADLFTAVAEPID